MNRLWSIEYGEFPLAAMQSLNSIRRSLTKYQISLEFGHWYSLWEGELRVKSEQKRQFGASTNFICWSFVRVLRLPLIALVAQSLIAGRSFNL